MVWNHTDHEYHICWYITIWYVQCTSIVVYDDAYCRISQTVRHDPATTKHHTLLILCWNVAIFLGFKESLKIKTVPYKKLIIINPKMTDI